MPTITKQKGNEGLLATQLAAGAQKHLANLTQVMFDGGTHTIAEVVTKLQSLATLRSDVDAARSTLKAKLTVERAQAPALVLFMTAFEAFVRAMFGNQPDILADFGLAPRKTRTPLTAKEQVAAAAKGEATRTARGTKGSTEKLAVKGNVTSVEITPVTVAPVTPEPAAPNAPPAPVNTGSAAK
ncbi:MAG TPA: hypothetical protein VF765_29375 [Polyangiaceae bacterium]